MRDENVSKYLRNDAKFANGLYEKYGVEKEGHVYMSQKMRALGRFMLGVKDHNAEDLYQVCTESRFSLALEAAKKMVDLKRKFKKSVALKIGNYLKWATEVVLGENDMGDEAFEPSHIHTTSPMQAEADILHLIDDVELRNFLKNAEDQAKLDLIAHPNHNSWKQLREILFAEITIFDRRRRRIAETIMLEDYIQRDKEPVLGIMCEPLTKLEQALKGVLMRVGVTCKDGSQIPVLFTERMAITGRPYQIP